MEYIPCISALAANSINKSNVWQPEPPAGYWSHEKGTNWHEKIGLCWNKGSGVNPYQSLEELGGYWNEPEKTKIKLKAPNGIYWICGEKAYSELPQKWKGSCTLEVIRPVSFILPRSESSLLGAPQYKTLDRKKREIKKFSIVGGSQTWDEEE